jgi:hypothetical protein
MDGYYLIPWDLLGDEYDFSWIEDNLGTENVVEGVDGYWVKNFPDTNPADNVPDFLQTGAGSGTTASQGWIQG